MKNIVLKKFGGSRSESMFMGICDKGVMWDSWCEYCLIVNMLYRIEYRIKNL